MASVQLGKNVLRRICWGAGNAVAIILTFWFGEWFVIFASMYAFLMGAKFAHNNWIVGMPKVMYTGNMVKKEDLKK